jgi:TRAP-type C4-dicarboxylate transport system permease small subunit
MKIYIQILFLSIIYIGAFYAVKRIFKIDFKDILKIGPKKEYLTNPGRFCLATFVILIVLGITNNKISFIEHLISSSIPQGSKEQVLTISPTILFIISVLWLIANFLIVSIFYKNRS